MKKLFTLLLVLTGMVSTASAKKLYVYVAESANAFSPADNARIMAHLWGATECDVEMDKEAKYGLLWYSCELSGNTNAIIVRQDPSYGSSTSIDWEHLWARTTDDITGLSTENDNYGELWYDTSTKKYGVWTGTSVRPGTEWKGLACRNNIDLWSVASSNMETTDNNSFTRTFTKAQIDEAGLSAGNKFYFKFKHIENVIFDESFNHKNTWTEIHPTADTEISFSETIDETYQASDESNKTWFVLIPSYDYEKLVFTANYVNDGSSYKWEVSADAYVTKTVNGEYQYATLGCSVPLEIVEANSVTAYPLTANASTGKIAKGDAITTIPANEGALLENTTGSDKTIRAKVLASAASSASNALHAYTSTEKIMQPGDGNTYYILGVQDEHVGFYRVNATEGNEMGENTAYLSVSGTSARAFWFDEDATAIEAVKQNVKVNGEYFDLLGRKVAQPAKGLYIVNGKKVVIK